MKKIIYNKLVRDKIPEIIRKKGITPITHTASEKEYWKKMKEKLTEEVSEFQDAENIEEIVDILEVLDAIAAFKKFSKKKILSVKAKKAKDKGKFRKKIILEHTASV